MNGCERLPANIGTSGAIDDDRVVVSYASNLTRRVYVPKTDMVGIIHAIPGLIGLARKNTGKTLEKFVVIIGQRQCVISG